jgi:hypothetical protein
MFDTLNALGVVASLAGALVAQKCADVAIKKVWLKLK